MDWMVPVLMVLAAAWGFELGMWWEEGKVLKAIKDIEEQHGREQ